MTNTTGTEKTNNCAAYLKVKEACAYLGCGYEHMIWLLSTGQIRGGKVSNQWRTTKEEIDRFVMSGGETITRSRAKQQRIPVGTQAIKRRPGRPRKSDGAYIPAASSARTREG